MIFLHPVVRGILHFSDSSRNNGVDYQFPPISKYTLMPKQGNIKCSIYVAFTPIISSKQSP